MLCFRARNKAYGARASARVLEYRSIDRVGSRFVHSVPFRSEHVDGSRPSLDTTAIFLQFANPAVRAVNSTTVPQTSCARCNVNFTCELPRITPIGISSLGKTPSRSATLISSALKIYRLDFTQLITLESHHLFCHDKSHL